MPKKPTYYANERVDIPDFTATSSGYTDDVQSAVNTRLMSGRKSYGIHGFRVEISDQTTAPGELTVYNGVAVDNTGVFVNNEDSLNDSRSLVLPGSSTTYYLEIEYRESLSNSEVRAFWDEDADNADPIPDGQEFYLPVPVKLTPDWTIVSPVSTTGFDVASNPDSSRIPLMVLSTNGSGEIDTAAAGLSLAVLSAVVEEDVSSGVDSLRVLNSDIFPSSGSVKVGFGTTSEETLTLSGNDRDNGILSFTANLANSHVAGEIVRVTGVTASFVKERTAAIPPGGGTHPDQQSRFFQGNETRGGALLSSKESVGGRDDLNVTKLKDYVDFLAGNLRDIRWGHPRTDTVSVAPPVSFSLTPRYYDPAGSLQGARCATFSVGDGSNSWGDFNADDETGIQEAVDALPAGGGIIFIKGGTYTFAAAVDVADKSVVFLGEPSKTVLTSAGIGFFSCTSTTGDHRQEFRGLTISSTTTLSTAVSVDDGLRTVIDNCTLTNVKVFVQGTADNYKNFEFTSNILIGLTGGSINAIEVVDMGRVYIGNNVFNFTSGANYNYINLDNFIGLATITDNQATMTSGSSFLKLSNSASSNMRNIAVTNSNFSLAGGGILKSTSTAQVSNFLMDNIEYQVSSALVTASLTAIITLPQVVRAVVSNVNAIDGSSDVSSDSSSTICNFIEAGRYSNDLDNDTTPTVIVSNVSAKFDSGYPFQFVVGYLNTDAVPLNLHVYNCRALNAYAGVAYARVGSCIVRDCFFDGTDETTYSTVGVVFLPTLDNKTYSYTVENCSIRNIKSSNILTTNYGIGVVALGTLTPSLVLVRTNFRNNYINGIGQPAGATTAAYGIFYNQYFSLYDTHISDNNINFIYSSTGGVRKASGIHILASYDFSIAGLGTVTIRDNSIYAVGLGLSTAEESYGISIFPLDSNGNMTTTTISDNKIFGVASLAATSAGIILKTGLSTSIFSDVDILNNSIRNVVGDTSDTTSGIIWVQGASFNNLSICNNFLDYESADKAGHGILVYATVGNSFDSYEVSVNSNKIHCQDSTVSGIWIKGTDSGGGNTSVFYDLSVNNNKVLLLRQTTESGYGGINISTDAHKVSVSDNSVDESVFYDNRHGINLSGFSGGSGMHKVTVTGNQTESVATTGDVRIFTYAAFRLRNAKACAVSNNVFTWSEDNGTADTNSIYIENSDMVTLSGNVIFSTGGSAADIHVTSGCNTILGTGNVIGNASANGSVIVLGSETVINLAASASIADTNMNA